MRTLEGWWVDRACRLMSEGHTCIWMTTDEFDELAQGVNDMLDRLERSMQGHKHAGDAIAHDLRSPLTRLRARLEASLIEIENVRQFAERLDGPTPAGATEAHRMLVEARVIYAPAA